MQLLHLVVVFWIGFEMAGDAVWACDATNQGRLTRTRYSLARPETFIGNRKTRKCRKLKLTCGSTVEMTVGHSVRPIGVLRSLQLHFKSLHSNLEAVHCLDGSLRARRIVEADKTCERWTTEVLSHIFEIIY